MFPQASAARNAAPVKAHPAGLHSAGHSRSTVCASETSTIDKMRRRVPYDLDYLDSWSLWLDFKILAKTVVTVIRERSDY
jgi:Bacterial sugar transferase